MQRLLEVAETAPGHHLVMFTVPWRALQPLGYVVGPNTHRVGEKTRTSNTCRHGGCFEV